MDPTKKPRPDPDGDPPVPPTRTVPPSNPEPAKETTVPEPNKEKPAVWIALAVIVCIALLGAGILAGRATTGGGSGPPGPSSYGGGGPPGASKPTYQVTDDDLRDWGEVQRLRERQKMAVENYERFGR